MEKIYRLFSNNPWISMISPFNNNFSNFPVILEEVPMNFAGKWFDEKKMEEI